MYLCICSFETCNIRLRHTVACPGSRLAASKRVSQSNMLDHLSSQSAKAWPFFFPAKEVNRYFQKLCRILCQHLRAAAAAADSTASSISTRSNLYNLATLSG